MATRTSSPPGSRSSSTSRSTASRGSASKSSSTRSRSTSKSPARTSKGRSRTPARGSSKRPAPARPRAVRNGPGPVARTFGGLGRGVASVWLGIAHALGAVARSIGQSARDLEPEHRRDGAGLFLIALAMVVAAAVWWQLPGGVMEFMRSMTAGAVGKVGWLVPLFLVYAGWRTLRDPERNGPAGRQVIGWSAFALGILGIVHIANGNPQPELGDASSLQQAGGAVGFVMSSLLLDLFRTPYVVVPMLALLAFFGVLIITATPVYQIPARLAAARDKVLGRGRATAPTPPRAPTTRPRRCAPAAAGCSTRSTPRRATRRTTPRCSRTARSSAGARRRTPTTGTDAGIDLFADAPTEATPVVGVPAIGRRAAPTRPARSSRRRTRRCRSASSSSRCPATSPTRCPATRSSSPARCTRPAPRPATPWSSGSCR